MHERPAGGNNLANSFDTYLDTGAPWHRGTLTPRQHQARHGGTPQPAPLTWRHPTACRVNNPKLPLFGKTKPKQLLLNGTSPQALPFASGKNGITCYFGHPSHEILDLLYAWGTSKCNCSTPRESSVLKISSTYLQCIYLHVYYICTYWDQKSKYVYISICYLFTYVNIDICI